MKDNNKKLHKYDLDLFVEDGIKKAPRKYKRVSREYKVIQIGKEILFEPDALNRYCLDGWQDVHHDLLILTAAVEYADRRKQRPLVRRSRKFKLTLPVSKINLWQSQEVQISLRDALQQLTGDNWHFNFFKSVAAYNYPDQKAILFQTDPLNYVIAYSDGLDSRCVSSFYSPEEIIRVRVDRKRNLSREKKPFDRIPFHVKIKNSHETSVHSRGFKFTAITAIASHLTNVKKIIVPESGQTALGPVLFPLHNVYGDYRNHPTFLRKMEKFIKVLLGFSVCYEQPRLWTTKGQTIIEYLKEGEKSELVNTRSCWQQRWNARYNGKLYQCGLCGACLLRRTSMHTAKIDEPDDTYLISDLRKTSYNEAMLRCCDVRRSGTMYKHSRTGVQEMQRFANMAHIADEDLEIHAFEIAKNIEGNTEKEVIHKLKKLATQHELEWKSFVQSLGDKSFINNWITEGHEDGP